MLEKISFSHPPSQLLESDCSPPQFLEIWHLLYEPPSDLAASFESIATALIFAWINNIGFISIATKFRGKKLSKPFKKSNWLL